MADAPHSLVSGPPLRWWPLADRLLVELNRFEEKREKVKRHDYEGCKKADTKDWWEYVVRLASELETECAAAVVYLADRVPWMDPEPILSLAQAIDQAFRNAIDHETDPDVGAVRVAINRARMAYLTLRTLSAERDETADRSGPATPAATGFEPPRPSPPERSRVWVRWRDRPGEFPIDLQECQRFSISDPSTDEWAEELRVYYLTPGEVWVQHSGHEMPVGNPEAGPWEYGETFTEADPVHAARDIFEHHGGKLPPELERYLGIVSDPKAFSLWMLKGTEWDDRGSDVPPSAAPPDLPASAAPGTEARSDAATPAGEAAAVAPPGFEPRRDQQPPPEAARRPSPGTEALARAGGQHAPSPVRRMKQPPRHAFEAYALHTEAGWKQDAVARKMAERLRRPGINQGTVSRWVAQVRKWKGAGNPSPGAVPRVFPTDPRKLDRGAGRLK
jgi:hypothetical protein